MPAMLLIYFSLMSIKMLKENIAKISILFNFPIDTPSTFWQSLIVAFRIIYHSNSSFNMYRGSQGQKPLEEVEQSCYRYTKPFRQKKNTPHYQTISINKFVHYTDTCREYLQRIGRIRRSTTQKKTKQGASNLWLSIVYNSSIFHQSNNERHNGIPRYP